MVVYTAVWTTNFIIQGMISIVMHVLPPNACCGYFLKGVRQVAHTFQLLAWIRNNSELISMGIHLSGLHTCCSDEKH